MTESGWYCDFRVLAYGVTSGHSELPWFLSVDIRGSTSAAQYYGKKPDPSISETDIVLDAFEIFGPGQLRIACPKPMEESEGAYRVVTNMQGCRISWRNQYQPDTTFVAGQCGEIVQVPRLYVPVPPK